MKKYLIALIVILGIMVGANSASAMTYFKRAATATATSSVVYMTPGTATTTLTIPTEGVDDVYLFIQFNASTTASQLKWTVDNTFDGIDWYGEDYGTVSAIASAHSSTTISNTWLPNATGRLLKVTKLTTSPALSKKVTFSLPIGTANGALYAELVTLFNSNR